MLKDDRHASSPLATWHTAIPFRKARPALLRTALVLLLLKGRAPPPPPSRWRLHALRGAFNALHICFLIQGSGFQPLSRPAPSV
jgi:hypothetical protein